MGAQSRYDQSLPRRGRLKRTCSPAAAVATGWAIAAAAWGLVAAGAADPNGRDRLRTIVQDECVPHWARAHDPGPCLSVTSGHGTGADGYAVLADRKGGAHYLLIPTRTIRGIESPEVHEAKAPNYFDAAWRERGVLERAVGRQVPRAAVGLAVNQLYARSQDQLHIHIGCLRAALHAALAAQAQRIGSEWAPLALGQWQYQAMRVMGTDLGTANPFALLADRLPGAREAMADYTLLVAGMDFREGPGFVLLAGTAVPGAELMLDSGCALAR